MGNSGGRYSKRVNDPAECYIISGGESRVINVWDLKEKKVEHVLDPPLDHTICDIVELGDDRHIASSDFSGKIKIWDLKTMSNVRTMSGHKDAVRKLCIFRPNFCLSASKDNTVKFWNIHTGELLDTYNKYCNGVSDIKQIGNNMIATTNNTTIRLWDINKKKIIQSYSGHFDWVTGLEYDEERDLLISGSWDKTLRLWDPRIRGLLAKPIMTIENTHQINSLLYSPLKNWIVIGDQVGNVICYDIKKLHRHGKQNKGKFGNIKFIENDESLPVISSPKSKKEENNNENQILLRRKDRPHSEVVFKMVWLENKYRFASCAADRTIRIYNLNKLTSTGYTLQDKDPINSMLFFKDFEHHIDNFKKLQLLEKMKQNIMKGNLDKINKKLEDVKNQKGGSRSTM